MAVRVTTTLNAINRGLENTKADKGAHLVEEWEAAVADLDAPGAKGIARDLAALRKQLESGSANADRIYAILHRLGAATTKIADKADKNGDKVRQLGEALAEAGEEHPDEAEDTEAAKNPKRKRAPAKADADKK